MLGYCSLLFFFTLDLDCIVAATIAVVIVKAAAGSDILGTSNAGHYYFLFPFVVLKSTVQFWFKYGGDGR
jgi:hypothetical protein